jgi:hypothetical protein
VRRHRKVEALDDGAGLDKEIVQGETLLDTRRIFALDVAARLGRWGSDTAADAAPNERY